VDAATAQLSWPVDYAGFVLEQKTSLTATTWVPATEPVTVAGGFYQTMISLTNSARFFRLRHP
jgi:hypothetical protein